ncbi:putative EGF-like module-containing mucin-like hormone receptor-like 3 [Apostichopus japonicus]|uniref:Putative EGF-like module-containing mucin-like hormone receptor-like 3 n=1 Tax=Stichopus japonicus TaxID=307972 RepID=A0A2G8KPH1_STIJA|nr:putative EGF-like module-containing mucin-like hormone receptor-like 3 [Apostichopus japonicus]
MFCNTFQSRLQLRLHIARPSLLVIICTLYSNASTHCSCHPACEIFRDCCYDTLQRYRDCSSGSEVTQFVTEILPNYREYFQCTTDVISANRYWLVSKCPASWTGVNQCDVRDNDTNTVIGGLNDHLAGVPVLSKNGVTFKNVYCALCHGEDLSGLSPWSFEAKSCDYTFYNETFGMNHSTVSVTDNILFLTEHCASVQFHPPTDHQKYALSIIPCHLANTEMIDTCEESEDIERAIASNCSIVSAPIHVVGKTFKNKFCSQCYWSHIGVQIMISEFCSPSINVDPMVKGPNFVPISITFNFGSSSTGASILVDNKQLIRTSITCDLDEVYDPFTSSCVPVMCQDGYYFQDGNCYLISNWTANFSGTCDQFFIKIITVMKTAETNTSLNRSCATHLETVSSCLMEILHCLHFNDDDVTCDVTNGNHYDSIEILTRTADIGKSLIKMTNTSMSSVLSRPIGCKYFDKLEISSRCIPEENSFDIICDRYQWLNETQWEITNGENSTISIMISNSNETLDISQVAIRHTFIFSSQNNIKPQHIISLQKCRFQFNELKKCTYLALNSSLFARSPNDSEVLVYLPDPSYIFSPDSYRKLKDGHIQVCNFLQQTGYSFFPRYSNVQTIMSTVGTSLSLLALSMTLLTYCLFPTLRKRRASILIMTLCGCLILAQLLLLSAGVTTENPTLCSIVSSVGHFFWLTAFSTTSVLGVTMVQTFSIGNAATRNESLSTRSIYVLLISCFGLPVAISGALYLLYLIDNEPHRITYGSSVGCWIGGPKVNLYAFGIPVGISLAMNLICFAMVSVSICNQKRKSLHIRKNKEDSQLRDLLIYTKIFFILGLTWISGFVAALVNEQWTWYLFIIFTSLQGMFIFIAFTVKSQIWNMWSKLLGIKRDASSTGSSHLEQVGSNPRKTAETSDEGPIKNVSSSTHVVC